MSKMFEVILDSILPSPSDQLLNKIQKYYHVKLPKDYIEFLKNYNGAEPIKNRFMLGSRCYHIDRFLCLLDDEIRESLENTGWNEIRVVITQLDEYLVDDEELVGMNLIPIAAVFAEDYICLDYRVNADNPAICLWYHEKSSEFAPSTQILANSFGQLLEMLTEAERIV